MQLLQLFISRKCNAFHSCIIGKIKYSFWHVISNFNKKKSHDYVWQNMAFGSVIYW